MRRSRLTFIRSSRVVAALIAASAVAQAHAAPASDRARQVLILYETARTSQLVVVGDREIPAILGDGSPGGIEYFAEFVDPTRFQQSDYQRVFRDFLVSKYAGRRFDLIIAMGDNALEFVNGTRSRLYPDTPVVFFATGISLHRPSNSTGMVSRLNFGGTLALAVTLQPDLRRVFVVDVSDSSNTARETELRTQFKPFEHRVAFTYFTDLDRADLETRLASLPPRSAVYFVTYNLRGTDEHLRTVDYLDRVSAVSNAPTYCWVDSAMDHGTVGGSMKSQTTQAQVIGQLGLRVLRGESADAIPVASVDLNVTQVDWRQLRRWGISEARVPAGTIVRFRDPTLWDRYRTYIIAAAVLLLAQFALIVGLLVQKRRRLFAEREARESAEKLRSSYERIRDLGGRLLEAQEAERARIARELHDDVSQQLALLAFDLDLMRAENQPQHRRRVDRLVQGAFDRAQDVAKSVHDLSHSLHPGRLQIGLVSALSGLEREFSTPDLQVLFSHEDVPIGLRADITLCLFRVAQEALHNAQKHSAARHVFVRLLGNDARELVLMVTDDGVGFNVDEAWTDGLGLVSMAERVESVGGRLKIRSEVGAGTYLEVSVPLPIVRLAEQALAVPVH